MADLIEETDDKLVLRKLIPASREEVFAAWSDPASIRHWMCPGDTKTAEAQIDFRVGGSFRIKAITETRTVAHEGQATGTRN